MLTGVSVGTGWDQLERAGPKEDRQVTLGNELERTGPKEDRQVTPHWETQSEWKIVDSISYSKDISAFYIISYIV